MTSTTIPAQPYEFTLSREHCALLIIDMQRDFLEPGGFGAMLGNDVALLRRAVPPLMKLLKAARASGMLVIHTREGHRPDLTDLPPSKKARGRTKTTIGDAGPMGRILIHGEPGHDIVPELYPIDGEPVIDKPGKGAFFATDLGAILRNRRIKQLWSAASLPKSASTPPCAKPTIAAMSAWWSKTVVLRTFPEFHRMGLAMISAPGRDFRLGRAERPHHHGPQLAAGLGPRHARSKGRRQACGATS